MISISILAPEKRFFKKCVFVRKTPVPPIVWNAQLGTKARGWGEETVDISDDGTQLRYSFIVHVSAVV